MGRGGQRWAEVGRGGQIGGQRWAEVGRGAYLPAGWFVLRGWLPLTGLRVGLLGRWLEIVVEYVGDT